MCAYITRPRFISRPLVMVATMFAAMIALPNVRAEVVDPLADGPVEPNLFTTGQAENPFKREAPLPRQSRQTYQSSRFDARQVRYQSKIPAPPTPPETSGVEVQALPVPQGVAAAKPPKDPCSAVEGKPLNQLGINIAEPAGKLPTDLAAPCWVKINSTESDARCWTVDSFNWNATCLCHNLLYFEEANLERYGYQCGDKWCCTTCGRECCCLQPAASAGHFYLSVLALPYCLVEQCPGDCVYTLGHYRPGSCNPWRRHWPPCDLIAATATAGFWVGMVAMIP